MSPWGKTNIISRFMIGYILLQKVMNIIYWHDVPGKAKRINFVIYIYIKKIEQSKPILFKSFPTKFSLSSVFHSPHPDLNVFLPFIRN